MKTYFLLAMYMAFINGRVCAQSLVPFYFTSEENNRLVKENDSVKFYVASGDSTNMVCINEEESTYKLLNKDLKVLAEGAFVTDGDKFLQDGKWTEHFENGKIKLVGYYRKNIPIGTWQEFYSNGKIKEVANYAVITGEHGEIFSCLSGTYKEYFENGQLKTNGFYSAAIAKAADTIYIEDPVTGRTVVTYTQHSEYHPEKTSHWDYYTTDGELDKKEDF